MSGSMVGLVVLGFLVLLGVLVGCVMYLYFGRLLFRSHVAQCSIPLRTIFGLFFRRVSPQIIVNSYIDLHKAGIAVTVEELEAHYKVRGNVRLVAGAMVAAKRDGHEVDFAQACTIDSSGGDVMKELSSGAELDAAAAK